VNVHVYDILDLVCLQNFLSNLYPLTSNLPHNADTDADTDTDTDTDTGTDTDIDHLSGCPRQYQGT
jgi:hypothetical protein